MVDQPSLTKRQFKVLADELVAYQDRLAALHELSARCAGTLDLDAALNALVEIARRALSVDTAVARLELPDRHPLVATSEGNAGVELPVDTLARLRLQGDFIVENGAAGTTWPVPRQLLLPLPMGEEIVGVLALIDRESGPFTMPEIRLAQALTGQLAIQIETTLRHEERVAQAAVAAQLALAREVQRALLPEDPPTIPGIEIWSAIRPLHEVGGDFCDFIPANAEAPAICVGDVCGKGVAAAILMNMTRTTLRNAGLFLNPIDPAQVISHANRVLYADYTAAGMFTSLFVGHFSPETGYLSYANAGHAPVIYCPAQGNARLLPASVAPVGLLAQVEVSTTILPFGPGDVLVVATDGITEATNDAGELFGLERLLEAVSRSAGQSAADIGAIIEAAVTAFSGGRRPTDDQTVLVCKRLTD